MSIGRVVKSFSVDAGSRLRPGLIATTRPRPSTSTPTPYDDEVALSMRDLMAAVRALSRPLAGVGDAVELGEALGEGSAAAKRALPGGTAPTWVATVTTPATSTAAAADVRDTRGRGRRTLRSSAFAANSFRRIAVVSPSGHKQQWAHAARGRGGRVARGGRDFGPQRQDRPDRGVAAPGRAGRGRCRGPVALRRAATAPYGGGLGHAA